jgi:hypothetical protein
MTAIRVFLFSCAMALSCQAESDPQSGRTLEQELRKDAAKRLTPEALLEMDEFARTYALSVMRRQRGGICTHAVDQFGPDGKQMQGLLLP